MRAPEHHVGYPVAPRRSSRNFQKLAHRLPRTHRGTGVPGSVGATLAGAAALLRGTTRSPQLDAELLLAHVLKRTRAELLAHREDDITLQTARAFTSLVRRRTEGIPLPYLTGRVEFYGRLFAVTPAVLIPRPETEAVIEEALRLLDSTAEFHSTVADIGTGSGILAVTIAAEAPRARVAATDRSPAALAIARRNARRHKVANRITFIESDLLTEIPADLAPQLIVANLPYVPSEELKHAAETPDTAGLAFEPQEALDGGPDGLFVIRRFFAQLKRLRTPSSTRRPSANGLQHVVLEHSPAQRQRILELVHDALPTFQPRAVSSFVTSWTKGE